MYDVVWLTMRRMRAPLMVMILVYTLSVFGMVMIPGQDAEGNAVQVGFLVLGKCRRPSPQRNACMR